MKKVDIQPIQKVPFTPENFEKIKRQIESKGTQKSNTHYQSYHEKRRLENMKKYFRAVLCIQSAIYNTFAFLAMTDAKVYLEKSDFWKKIKPYHDAAVNSLSLYEKKMITRHFHERFEMVCEVADNAWEKTKEIRKSIIFNLTNLFGRMGIEIKETVAYTVFAQIALNYSVDYYLSFDKRMRSKVPFGIKELKCKDVFVNDTKLLWEKILEYIPLPDDVTVSENEILKDKTCMDALEKLFAKLGNTEFLIEITEEALSTYDYLLDDNEKESLHHDLKNDREMLALGRILLFDKHTR